MVKLIHHVYKEFDAEAVCIISNQPLTQKVVYGLMTRGKLSIRYFVYRVTQAYFNRRASLRCHLGFVNTSKTDLDDLTCSITSLDV